MGKGEGKEERKQKKGFLTFMSPKRTMEYILWMRWEWSIRSRETTARFTIEDSMR